ncbi:MAG TPA: phytanoyl-CoA dioxygenase family protein [Pirellulales bacterium]|jgi:hypothetical protein
MLTSHESDVPAQAQSADELSRELEVRGIVRLPQIVDTETLRDMQASFAARLDHVRWNNQDGYERTERFRHMVQDVLTLSQGFVDVALHPLVKDVLQRYLGDAYELVEAKGWKSLRTTRGFHGWHGDAWYDQDKVRDQVPREVKLGFYLSDVHSGAFQYISGTHGKQAPRPYFAKHEYRDLSLDQIAEMRGPMGTAFLFDTSGIHRQATPILESRQAFFLNYHDPSIPLQKEDIDYYRYHPLLLNAALLGNLSADDYRILGFGNKANYLPAYRRISSHAGFQAAIASIYGAKLAIEEFGQRVAGKLRRLIRIR